MKPYYQVFAKDSNMFTLCTTKEVAKQERKAMQEDGIKTVYIKKKHRTSRISDYHQGGY